MTTQKNGLASVVDTADRTPYGLAAIKGMIWIHWAERWTLDQRKNFLGVMEREFPALAADVMEHMERCACEKGDAS